MSKVYIGCDPGKNGAIAIMDGDVIITECFPMIGDEYDIKAMYERFYEFTTLYDDIHFVLEDVSKMPMPYNSGDWELSASKHIILTLLVICEIPFTLVRAKEWQKEIFQGIPEQREPNKSTTNKKGEIVVKQGKLKTKVMSLMACQRLLPTVDLRDPNRKTDRAKTPHDGVTDSLCLALYAKRKFN